MNFIKQLEKEFEGVLFRVRFVAPLFDDDDNFFIDEHLYTVISGEVYELHNGKLSKTGDDITKLCSHPKIGKFNKSKIESYESPVRYEFNIKDAKKVNR